MSLQDAYSRPKYCFAAAMKWLRFRLDVLSSITFLCSLVFLITVPEGAIDPGKCTSVLNFCVSIKIYKKILIKFDICFYASI